MFSVNNVINIKNDLSPEEKNRKIKEAAHLICGIFKHSPVFRLSNDEFAAISKESDYVHLDELINNLELFNEKNTASNDMVIAFGTARFENDPDVNSVYERAVKNLKENYNESKTA